MTTRKTQTFKVTYMQMNMAKRLAAVFAVVLQKVAVEEMRAARLLANIR